MHRKARIKRAIANPRLFARGFNRLYHQRLGYRSENPDGADVFSEDWDTLVVLDACRYDMFESSNHIEGTLSAKQSKGSSTSEWLRTNFDGRDLRDTVYVTANPQLERNWDEWDVKLHNTINVWLDEGWDDETGTVLADTMTGAAIDALERFPNKRLVVHYMQPHYPFVRSDTEYDKQHLNSIGSGNDDAEGTNVWNMKFEGDLDSSREELWSIYEENLEYVLEYVEELLDAISGKTVVTADHGNYVGERASPIPVREWGHPRGLYDGPAVKVPWFVHESGARREISAAEMDDTSREVESEVVADRLQDLGYRE